MNHFCIVGSCVLVYARLDLIKSMFTFLTDTQLGNGSHILGKYIALNFETLCTHRENTQTPHVCGSEFIYSSCGFITPMLVKNRSDITACILFLACFVFENIVLLM